MRNIIITISIILVCFHAHCQENQWEEGNAEMRRFEREHDIKRAIEVGEKTLAFVVSKYGMASTESAIVMENLAANYIHLDEYKKAKPLLFACVDFEFKTNGETKDLASMYTNLGNCYRTENIYDSAEYYYKKSLALYEAMLGSGHKYTIITKSDLAVNFLMKDQTDLAAILLEQVLVYYKEKNDSLYCAYTMHELGKAYTRLNRLREAEKNLRSAVSIFEKSALMKDPAYEFALMDLGIFMVEKKQDNTGKEFIKKAIIDAQRKYGTESSHVERIKQLGNKYLANK